MSPSEIQGEFEIGLSEYMICETHDVMRFGFEVLQRASSSPFAVDNGYGCL